MTISTTQHSYSDAYTEHLLQVLGVPFTSRLSVAYLVDYTKSLPPLWQVLRNLLADPSRITEEFAKQGLVDDTQTIVTMARVTLHSLEHTNTFDHEEAVHLMFEELYSVYLNESGFWDEYGASSAYDSHMEQFSHEEKLLYINAHSMEIAL